MVFWGKGAKAPRARAGSKEGRAKEVKEEGGKGDEAGPEDADKGAPVDNRADRVKEVSDKGGPADKADPGKVDSAKVAPAREAVDRVAQADNKVEVEVRVAQVVVAAGAKVVALVDSAARGVAHKEEVPKVALVARPLEARGEVVALVDYKVGGVVAHRVEVAAAHRAEAVATLVREAPEDSAAKGGKGASDSKGADVDKVALGAKVVVAAARGVQRLKGAVVGAAGKMVNQGARAE